MSQYKFDYDGQVPFRRLIVRSAARGPNPVHFFVFQDPSKDKADEDDAGGECERRGRAYLDSLISADVGTRLVNL